MSGGGIIIQRNAALLVAITDHSLYCSLSLSTKAAVDAIDAKDPASRTERDVLRLVGAIAEACCC